MKSTAFVPRVLNPIFNATLVFESLSEEGRLQIVLRDTGLLHEAHVGGFGPRVIATTSLPMADFAGWIELTPMSDIPNNGGPVMLLDMKVRAMTPWPAEGFVASVRQAFQTEQEPEASAPPPPNEEEVDVTGKLDQPEFRGFGVTGEPEPSPEEFAAAVAYEETAAKKRAVAWGAAEAPVASSSPQPAAAAT